MDTKRYTFVEFDQALKRTAKLPDSEILSFVRVVKPMHKWAVSHGLARLEKKHTVTSLKRSPFSEPSIEVDGFIKVRNIEYFRSHKHRNCESMQTNSECRNYMIPIYFRVNQDPYSWVSGTFVCIRCVAKWLIALKASDLAPPDDPASLWTDTAWCNELGELGSVKSPEAFLKKKAKEALRAEEYRKNAHIAYENAKKELFILVWTMPTIEVARLEGVSDSAIEKRCKQYGIPKPPRGFWAKRQTGKPVDALLSEEMLVLLKEYGVIL